MSEENKGLEAAVDQAAQQEVAKEYTPIQQKALEQGWKPKDQFEGDEENFIDAPEFVRRGELFSKIESQSKELKAIKQALHEFKSSQSKARAADLDRAQKNLKQSARQAILDGEPEKAFQIEDQIEYVRAERERIEKEASQPAVQELNPEFVAWESQNKWYSNDKTMRAVADQLGYELASQGIPPGEVLKRVSQEVRKEFAHKFSNPKAERPSAVAGSSRSGARQEADMELSDIERAVMKKVVASGAMTEAEYKKELKKSR